MTTTTLADLIAHDRELTRRIKELSEQLAHNRADIAALCPSKPGTVHTNNRGGRFWLERVSIGEGFSEGDGLAWQLQGKQLRVDGVTPHATATAYDWLPIPGSKLTA